MDSRPYENMVDIQGADTNCYAPADPVFETTFRKQHPLATEIRSSSVQAGRRSA